jgi:hypothetical protein
MADEDVRRALNEAVLPGKYTQRDKDEADAAAFRLHEDSPWTPKPNPVQSALQRGTLPIIKGEDAEIGIRLGRGPNSGAMRDYEHEHGIRHGKTAGIYLNWNF